MRIKTPKFILKMVSKYVSNQLTDELGFNIYVNLNSLEVDTKGPRYNIRMDNNVEIDKRGIKEYIKSNLQD